MATWKNRYRFIVSWITVYISIVNIASQNDESKFQTVRTYVNIITDRRIYSIWYCQFKKKTCENSELLSDHF